MQTELRQQLTAEFVGTFMLVLAGCGAIVFNDISGGAIGHAGIAATFGLVVMTGIYAVGDTSGAHFNPAVTLAFAASGRFAKRKVAPFWAAQLAGAILAAAILKIYAPEHQTLGATVPAMDVWRVALLELILTWWLVVVIMSVATGAKEKGLFAGIAIGATVALEAMFAGPITGASMNPARSIGPALLSGELHDLWLYIVAPMLGALLAVATCRHIHSGPCCEPE
jgi:aquaporin NIP